MAATYSMKAMDTPPTPASALFTPNMAHVRGLPEVLRKRWFPFLDVAAWWIRESMMAFIN
jgi:hypothetical protein